MALEHHKKAKVAVNRPAYREARWERAVKVYTINKESKYLLVQNVHALGVTQELLQQFALYGDIEEYRLLDEYPSEEYTDVYWIKFADIDAARIAKKKLDNRSFFGKNLHVCYAPEYESVQDTREKLLNRRKVIEWKTRGASSSISRGSHAQETQESLETVSAPGPPSTSNSVVTSPSFTTTSSIESSSVLPQQSLEDYSSRSCDSHMTQFPILPTPPIPHAHMPYQSSSQFPSQQTNNSPPQLGKGKSKFGTKTSGSKMKQSIADPSESISEGKRKGTSSLDENIFNPAGLSIEDRVSAYLARSVDMIGSGGDAGGRGDSNIKAAKRPGEKRKHMSSEEPTSNHIETTTTPVTPGSQKDPPMVWKPMEPSGLKSKPKKRKRI